MSRLVIEAGKTELGYWADLWRFRELFLFLSWRDILVRYKQTAIGILWAIIRPLLTMLIFTFIFQKLANMPGDGLPYAVMVSAGQVPWQFFSSSMTEAGGSLITNGPMLSKIYFPRLIIPASAVIVSFFDFLISLVILAGLMLWFGVVPDWRILLLPAFTVLGFFASFGPSLWLAALNVKFRDFRYVVPFIVQIGQYVSPVGYDADMIRHKYGAAAALLYSLNPMVGVINGFRWAVGGTRHVAIDWTSVGISAAVVLLIATTGLAYFRKIEQTFADII
jgi:lipopolysaccharide transport system permease protein